MDEIHFITMLIFEILIGSVRKYNPVGNGRVLLFMGFEFYLTPEMDISAQKNPLINVVIEAFYRNPQFRMVGNKNGEEDLTYIVAGYVTGHTTLRRCLEWCRRHENWLKKGLVLLNGIASLATVSRLLSGIDDELFLFAFMEWIGEILSTKGLHLAIDGKVVKAASKIKGTRVPMLLNAIDAVTGWYWHSFRFRIKNVRSPRFQSCLSCWISSGAS